MPAGPAAPVGRPRLLFLAPRYPDPPLRGDQRRVLHLLEGLSRRADVTLLTFGAPGEHALPGIRVRPVALGPLDATLGNLSHPDPRLPGQVRLFLSRRMQRAVADELRREPPAVVHVTLARMAPYLPPRGPWHRHLDLIDALSVNMRTRARASPAPLRAAIAWEARLLASYEARAALAADSATVVSEDDRRNGPGLGAVDVLPNGVDTDAFAFAEPSQRAPVLLFFGNLGYFHNVEPARFVAREVLPRVRARHPEARLRIVGARPGAGVRRLGELSAVDVVGPVEDMAAELHGAAAAVVPMFSGSGIKNKVLEAFSAGTPVVTNRRGVAGVEGAFPGEHYRSAESAPELAQACLAALDEPQVSTEMARAARRLVERDYSWSARVTRLCGLYGGRLD